MGFKEAFWAAALAYLIGNVSPSIILSKLKGRDIRTLGSGNAGSTNMLRSYGLFFALLTLSVDVLKGVLAVYVGRHFGGSGAYIAAVFVILGHIWPVLWGFKGGKGVASALGAALAVDFGLGALCLLVALLVMLFTKKVSAGSLSGCVLVFPLSLFLTPEFSYYALFMAMIMILKHKENIKRLIRGEEPEISFKKTKAAEKGTAETEKK